MIMKLRILAAIVICLLLHAPAYAFSWAFYDFGADPFDHNDNWSPIYYPHGVGNRPSPGPYGEGGEKFDLEGFHSALNGDSLYLALTASFQDSVYSTGWNQWYNLGDIFIDVNGGDWDYAVDVSKSELVDVDAWSYISNIPGSYYNKNIIRAAVGAFEVSAGTSLTTTQYVSNYYSNLEFNPLAPSTYRGTYVMEWALDLGGLSDADRLALMNPAMFHVTLECGNDLIEEPYSTPPPVPEPASIVLFALGAGAAALKLRRLHNHRRSLHDHLSTFSTARNASCGISTDPTCFIRFLPSFWRSKSFRFRVISPP
jgi:hypothetical protein